MKKYLRAAAGIFLSLALMMGMSTVPAAAASGVPVDEVSYEGNGKVEVDLGCNVTYGKIKITVKDNKGKSYKVKVIEKDNDDIEFRILKFRYGRTYKFTIKNVYKNGSSVKVKIKGKVKIPAKTKLKVKEVDYDAEDKTVDIDFKGNVKWKNPVVSIKDAAGKEYCQAIVKKDKDDVEVRVSALTLGEKYTYTVSGVKKKGEKSYSTVKGTFKAIDD